MKDKKIFIVIFIIVILVCAVAGGYYLMKKSLLCCAPNTQENQILPVSSDKELNQPVSPVQPQATQTPSSSSLSKKITIDSPNGGEVFIKGKRYEIAWNTSASFNSSYPQVSITLITAEGKQVVMPQQQIITDNTGGFEWIVPDVKLSGYIKNDSGSFSLQDLDDKTEFQFLIEGYPHTTGRAEGPFDYTDGSFKIVPR